MSNSLLKVYTSFYPTLLISLLLISQISSKIRINNKDIKKLSLIETNEEGDLSFNYSDGTWYKFHFLYEDNPDGRLFEFHPNKMGLLNYKNAGLITQQAFFSSQNVLVFYYDKEPIITYSILDIFHGEQVDSSEIEEIVEKYDKENKKIFGYMNHMPYYKIAMLKNANTNLLWDLPGQLQMLTNVSGIQQEVDPVMETSNINEIIDGICKVLYGYYESKKPIILSDYNYYNKWIEYINKTNEKKENKEFFDSIITYEGELFDSSSEIHQTFQTLFAELRYLTHRVVRDYFFRNHLLFMQRLFNGFLKNTSTFSQLYDKNILNSVNEDVFAADVFLHILPDLHFDKQFTNLKESDDVQLIENKLWGVFKTRIETIETSLKKIVEYMLPMVKQVFENAEQPEIKIETLDDVSSIFQVFMQYNGGVVYSKYAQRVKEAFPNLEGLKKNDIDNLEDPKDFAEFRWRMLILGYAKFEEGYDRKEMDYVDYKGFKKVGNRIVLV